VDGYQGKENDIVIVSLVRNNTDGPIEAGLPTIAQGFMFRPNRINVALSRARDRLVIVGSVRGWPMDGPLAAVSAEVRALCAVGEADVV
jgi:superfamily I DNA and/or RNA helicase